MNTGEVSYDARYNTVWNFNIFTIKASSGFVGIGTDNPGTQLEINGPAGIFGDGRYNLTLLDDTSIAAGVGTGIIFGGVYTAGGAQTGFSMIWGEKENATSGNFAGQLHLGTRVSGGAISSDLVIDSLGRIGIGLTVPKTKLTVEGTITLKEQANADGDSAGYGQLWCKDNAGTTELWFTTDTGTDTKIV